jgi:hypothetical protein
MITYAQVRSALLGAEPRRELDRLVRAELAAGRKTAALYDELLGHVDAIRMMPEYRDELEDPLGDTLDALCGWVHESCAYRDAPEPAAPHPPAAVPQPDPHAARPPASADDPKHPSENGRQSVR